MEQLLIQGLDGEGPGDILGAITHQAEIDGEMVGDIDIRGDYAVVEIDANLIDLVISKMEDNFIGTSRVSVKRFDEHDTETLEAVYSYLDTYRDLVELEREQEMENHEDEIRAISGQEREDRGRALLAMQGQDEGEDISGRLIKFLKAEKGTPLPEVAFGVGDLLMVSKHDPLREDNPTGTVTQVTNYSVTVAFESEPPSFVYDTGIRLDLYVNDITYQRMLDALEELEHASGRLVALRDIIAGRSDPVPVEEPAELSFINEDLNQSQREAVRKAIAAEDIFLIHGPPGTGKTTTLIEVIAQAVRQDEFVLATAASNTAVDNIVTTLLGTGIDVVRVGHPARVTDRLHEQTLAHRIQQNETYHKAEKKREQAHQLLDEQEELTAPSGRYRRGMSNDRIMDLAENGEGARGVPPDRIAEMAEYLELEDRIDAMFEEAEELEDQAIEEELLTADVVCTTNATAGREMFDSLSFDLLVIDEATQATEPSCLIPITHADRLVMAGDHRQLPPTVLNQEAADRGLHRSLFESLIEDHEGISHTLQTQYRMHETIMGFPDQSFYETDLVAADAVRDHTLADRGVSIDGTYASVLNPEEPLVFIDTSESDTSERSRHGSTSTENPFEAGLVKDLVDALLENGVLADSIGVITPYADQVDRIQELLDDSVEVDTVDGFQGREKDVIILSLTRSNEDDRIGFLDDERRLNVAMTRAREKLVVVGDSETLTTAPVFASLLEYIDAHGHRYQAT